MNPELEALIRAYDEAKQAAPQEVNRLRAIYESQLEEVLRNHPNLSRQALLDMVRFARNRWLNSQQKPTFLPPHA